MSDRHHNIADPKAIDILKQIESLGPCVAVYRKNGGIELNTYRFHVGKPTEWFTVKSDDDSPEGVYRAVCELAERVGVELEG